MNNDELKSNLLSKDHWLRFLYMALFVVILYFASIVALVVVVLQFLFALISGRDNGNLRQFGQQLSHYILHALQFLTYNSDAKPFPFDDWPDVAAGKSGAAQAKRKAPAKKAASKKAASKKTASKKTASKKAPVKKAEVKPPEVKPPVDDEPGVAGTPDERKTDT